MTRLEIAVTSIQDALHAEQGGADSIEISVDLANDGLTPPYTMVEEICKQAQLDVHAIVRPTARDFIYTETEQQQIFEDIEKFKQIPNLKGIVFGAQTSDGKLDISLIKDVVHKADALIVTVHRALDTCTNP